jgi:hypothetical protein
MDNNDMNIFTATEFEGRTWHIGTISEEATDSDERMKEIREALVLEALSRDMRMHS